MKRVLLTGFVATFSLTACQTIQFETANSAAAIGEFKEKDAIGAYMIVRGKNYDREALAPYSAALPPIYRKYGGYYVGFGPQGAYETLEGTEDSGVILISAWPSVEAAQKFWTSPEYSKAIKLREGNGEFTVVIIPAVPQTQ